MRGGYDLNILSGGHGKDEQDTTPNTPPNSGPFDVLNDNLGNDFLDGAFAVAADWIDAT